jgi:hypothetical protein
MTRPYSVAFKQKMIEQLTGKDAACMNIHYEQLGRRSQNGRRAEGLEQGCWQGGDTYLSGRFL